MEAPTLMINGQPCLPYNAPGTHAEFEGTRHQYGGAAGGGNQNQDGSVSANRLN